MPFKIPNPTPALDAIMDPSVLDPPWRKAARVGGKLLGLDDPNSLLMGPAMPEVSIFKDAAGIPSKALREASTDVFRTMARSLPPRITQALDEFASKYPRVAAHMRPESSYLAPTADIDTSTATTAPMKVRFGKSEQALSNRDPYKLGIDRARETTWHEGTHAAQALGNNKFQELYDLASSEVGYPNNPFELAASNAGSRAISLPIDADYRPPVSALKELEFIARPELQGKKVTSGPQHRIMNILKERRGY